jgi:selenocysteine-specific elongation factor
MLYNKTGFSSFTIESSDSLKQKGYDFVQYTLVDCPGHASLIKTIIGGDFLFFIYTF